MIKHKAISLLFISGMLLGACSNGNGHEGDMSGDMEGMEHGEMNHEDTGALPKGLKEAPNPQYGVGSKAILKASHMKGMESAEATIAGAYDTVVYTVSYTPTTGGEKVKNHKWVIHEELQDVGDQPVKPGDEVVLNTEHMKGMKGASATIDSAEKMTVYMVDYTPVTGGEKVKHHKWVTGTELSPVE